MFENAENKQNEAGNGTFYNNATGSQLKLKICLKIQSNQAYIPFMKYTLVATGKLKGALTGPLRLGIAFFEKY